MKKSTTENADIATSLQVYKETQDDLTSELADFKEKYREIVELLHDTQYELKQVKKQNYPGVGEHKVSEMFSETSNTEKKAKSNGKTRKTIENSENITHVHFKRFLAILEHSA